MTQTEHVRPSMDVLDERDQAILAERLTALDAIEGPRVGDVVRFADGVVRRISHHWGDKVQTSDHGSYYLGNGYVSMSGSLFGSVPVESLEQEREEANAWVWFFHHDWHKARNGVDVEVPVRVFLCYLNAPG